MNEQKFSTRQAVSLVTMFLIGQVLILYNGNPANGDIWLSILVAYVATVPLALLYARLINVFPGKNMYDLQVYLFGPVFGKALNLLYTLYFLHIGSLVLKDVTNFIQVTSLLDTPQLISAVMIGLLCIYVIKSGANTLARYTALAMPVYLLIILATALLATTLWTDFTHLAPVLYNGFRPMLKSALDMAIFPFADAAVLPFVLQPLKEHRKARRIFLASYSISAVFFLIVFVEDILVLGKNYTSVLYFPSYVMVSLIDIGGFLQRIEVVVGAIMFMGAFIKISIYLYALSLGISKVLGSGDYRKFAAPSGLLVVAFSMFAYPNSLANIAFAANIYPYYGLVIDVVIPLIIWACAEWRRKKLKDKGQLPEPPPAATETPVARQDGGIPQNPDGPMYDQLHAGGVQP
jgi:spore germination protein KB